MLLVDFVLPNFADPNVWLSMLTLTFLEIVLGVDNIIFVSIVANQLPRGEQSKARNQQQKKGRFNFHIEGRFGVTFSGSYWINNNSNKQK